MIDILYTIITFSSMLILFKYFGKYQVNNLQAIIVNYFTAGSLALFIANVNGIPNRKTAAPAVANASEIPGKAVNLAATKPCSAT